ncbi:hypothetical protein [Mucilaginibacter sp.]|uniref:hypothetical protein n=1 Tax=Mucilaginibacter sp. TaxID=1882438 RepID=UPI0032643D2C
MTTIEVYYDLLRKKEISDFKISLYAKRDDEKQELASEQEKNNAITNELEQIKVTLTENSDDADKVRVAFVFVANGVLKSLEQIKAWGSHYPDLSQGMIVPGYLFGKILNDFNIALKYEGGMPVVEIFMSRREWEYEPLQSLIQQFRDELVKTHFQTKMDAVNYYEHIRESILAIVDDLRKKGII